MATVGDDYAPYDERLKKNDPRLSIEEALVFHAQVGYRAIELSVLPGFATAVAVTEMYYRRHSRAEESLNHS